MTFAYLTGRGQDHHGLFIEVVESRIRELIIPVLMNIEVDETWYLKMNHDVRDAITEGKLASAREHYVNAGYFENRQPRKIMVDQAWYVSVYPDVAAAIRFGNFQSAQLHFETEGFREGRLAFEGWNLHLSQMPSTKKTSIA